MNHNLSRLHGLLTICVRICGLLIGIAHFHVFAFAFDFFFLLVLTAAAFCFEIFAAGIADIVILVVLDLSCSFFGAIHIVVFFLCATRSHSFGLRKLLLKCCLHFGFFGTVCVSVILKSVGFWLVWWVFGRC